MGKFVTNRDDVEAHIRQGNWVVAFSNRELTETDVLGLLVASGVAYFTDQPEVVIEYLDELVRESIQGMETSIAQTLPPKVQNVVSNFAIPYLRALLQGRSPGEQATQFGDFGIKAGLAQFIGHNEVWNPIANPGGIVHGDTGAWQQVGPGLVSYCPYVGIRYRSGGSGGPSPNANYTEIFVQRQPLNNGETAWITYINLGSGRWVTERHEVAPSGIGRLVVQFFLREVNRAPGFIVLHPEAGTNPALNATPIMLRGNDILFYMPKFPNDPNGWVNVGNGQFVPPQTWQPPWRLQ